MFRLCASVGVWQSQVLINAAIRNLGPLTFLTKPSPQLSGRAGSKLGDFRDDSVAHWYGSNNDLIRAITAVKNFAILSRISELKEERK